MKGSQSSVVSRQLFELHKLDAGDTARKPLRLKQLTTDD